MAETRGTFEEQQAIIAERRMVVSSVYLQGYKNWEIVEFLKDHHPELARDKRTISDDLKAIREVWKEHTVKNYEAHVSATLMKLDRLERINWEKGKWDMVLKIILARHQIMLDDVEPVAEEDFESSIQQIEVIKVSGYVPGTKLNARELRQIETKPIDVATTKEEEDGEES